MNLLSSSHYNVKMNKSAFIYIFVMANIENTIIRLKIGYVDWGGKREIYRLKYVSASFRKINANIQENIWHAPRKL